MEQIKVLFVCLGNICRSPMAEGIFASLVEEKGYKNNFIIDSAGTSGWHSGELADPNMRATALNHGIELTHRSRKFTKQDFKDFDYIIPMDKSNLNNIKAMESNDTTGYQITLMRAYDEQYPNADVEDPYGMNMNGFENCYQVLRNSCSNFLDTLIKEYLSI